MREIKFRAWEGLIKKISKPFYIDELKFGYISDIDNCIMDRDLILMQYTGLKDKNDKEIYESDIVREYTLPPNSEILISIIKWKAPSFIVDRSENGHIRSPKRGLEIIGNIYENPELLKEN